MSHNWWVTISSVLQSYCLLDFIDCNFLCCSNFEQCETVCEKGPYQEHQFGHESHTCVGVTENVEQESVLEK